MNKTSILTLFVLAASCAGVLAAEPENKEGKAVAGKAGSLAKEDLDRWLSSIVRNDPEPAKKYEWWNTTRGSIEKVVSPWTPVTLKGNTLGIWGREMEIGAAGLPARVSTQGKEILAAPGRLVATLADGKELTAEGVKTKTRFDQDHRKIVEVESQLGDIAVTSEVRAEFDGLYKVTLTLTPKAPTAVKSLRVVLPYAVALAEYLHAATTGTAGGSYYGFTPKGEGRVWDCRALGDKTMKVGSFIPYIWLGSTTGGLCWFADSDQGWIPTDETPAIEIQRPPSREATADKGEVDLVLNLISSMATLDAPRTITFALQASPVKPMAKAWRTDNWRCGDTFFLCAPSPFLKINLLRHSGDVPGYVEIVRDQHSAGRLAIAYFSNTDLTWHYLQATREFKDGFPEKWLIGSKTPAPAFRYGGSLNDYMVYQWSRYVEGCGIDGCLIGNVTPYPCDNLNNGNGYRLPDGRVQPAFQMFGLRECLLRIRAAFLEQRQTCKIVLNMNDRLIVPWVGAADVVYNGTQHAILPESKQDFMDLWPLERLRAVLPSQWGTGVNFMHQYQGNWDPRALHLALRAHVAAVLLHDALPTPPPVRSMADNPGQVQPDIHADHARNLIAMLRWFGTGAEDVKFLPYWDDTGLSAKGGDIKLAAWLRPQKLLFLVANFGEKQTAQASLDLEKLGWKGATLAVSDPEQGQSLIVSGQAGPVTITYDAPAPMLDGTKVTVPVERHNFRLLVVERK